MNIKQAEFPEDGTCSWDYNSKNDEYEFKYTEGNGDRAWMEEKDHNYMRRIARTGTASEKAQLMKEIQELKTDEGPEEDKKPKKESYARFFDAEIKKFEEEQRKLKEDAKARAETEQRRKEAERLAAKREADRKRKAEADRIEAEKQARLSTQEKARKEEEAKRRAQEEARKKAEAERKKKEEEERLKIERLEEERIQKELEQERQEVEKLRRRKELEELKREKEKLKRELQNNDQPAIATSPQEEKEDKTLDQSYLISYVELQFESEIGHGGFGSVFQGKWQYSPVAIKKLYLNKLSDHALQDFKDEASVMTKLHHINVLRLYGVSIDRPGHYSLVIEYMPKGSLSDLLRSRNPLNWDLRYRISMDVCAGLLHLHKQNILHRDLKSMNVLLDENMRAKLSDFGLSKLRNETTATATMGTGSAVGTVSWMAPELFKRKGKYNKASDVYSLGMVFWEIASRLLPFQDALNSDQIIAWKKDGEHEDIPEDCPTEYGDMIKECWKEQNARPSVEFLISSLEKIFNPAQSVASQSIHQSGPVYQLETKKNVDQSGPVYQM